MFPYIWPVALVVLSNTLYQICAKSVPEGMSPLTSLTISYLIGAVVSFLLYFALNRNADLVREIRQLNWGLYMLSVRDGRSVSPRSFPPQRWLSS